MGMTRDDGGKELRELQWLVRPGRIVVEKRQEGIGE